MKDSLDLKNVVKSNKRKETLKTIALTALIAGIVAFYFGFKTADSVQAKYSKAPSVQVVQADQVSK